MDLARNWRPRFTEWAVRNGYPLAPLVLVDAGAQGGIHPRWDSLGGRLVAHGFDPLAEAIAAIPPAPNRRYHCLALGAQDGEREIFLASESTATSFYPSGGSPYATDAAAERTKGTRLVPVRSLDSLMREGAVPRADFIKIDCEGAEPEILDGARGMLGEGVVAVEVETNFNVSATYPQSHFQAVSERLLSHGFVLQDIAFDRVRTQSFVERARHLGIGLPVSRARPATCNALFCRAGAPRNADALIKRAIVLELYGMCDAAFHDLTAHKAMLPPGADWPSAADLLIRRPSLAALARHVSASIAHRLKR